MPEFIQERKSKDGKYVTYKVCMPYYDKDNNRKFFTESFSSKKYGSKKIALELAKECRDKMKVRLDNNIIESRVTLKEVMEAKESVFSHSAQTKRKHISIYNKYITPFIDEYKEFRKINQREIFITLDNAKSKATDETISRIFGLWKQLYKTAIINEWVSVDMTMKVIPPKTILPKKKREQTTSFDELESVCFELEFKMKNKKEARKIVLALHIMYYTGIRPAECYALTKSNIDLENRTITICQSVSTDDNRIGFISRTKNETSIRTIPYPCELDSIFEELYSMSNDDLLFLRDKNSLFTGEYVAMKIRNNTSSNFTAYKLRHQFATDLVLNNTDIRTIQELMGHASSSMTIGYARSNKNKMKEAVNKRSTVAKTVAKNE